MGGAILLPFTGKAYVAVTWSMINILVIKRFVYHLNWPNRCLICPWCIGIPRKSQASIITIVAWQVF